MKYLSECYTTGGPIAVVQKAHLSCWDARGDYHFAVNQPRNGSIQPIYNFKRTCDICLFYQESDGNFHVFFDRTNIVVLSEIFAEEGYEIGQRLPNIEESKLDKSPMVFSNFGSKIAIFDATIPGLKINLVEVGFSKCQFGDESIPFRYDMALVEVDSGDWEASELFFDTDYLSFSGLWFQYKNA